MIIIKYNNSVRVCVLCIICKRSIRTRLVYGTKINLVPRPLAHACECACVCVCNNNATIYHFLYVKQFSPINPSFDFCSHCIVHAAVHLRMCYCSRGDVLPVAFYSSVISNIIIAEHEIPANVLILL